MDKERKINHPNRVAKNCEKIVSQKAPLTNHDLVALCRGIITIHLGRSIKYTEKIDLPLSPNLSLHYTTFSLQPGKAHFVEIESKKTTLTGQPVTEVLAIRPNGDDFFTFQEIKFAKRIAVTPSSQTKTINIESDRVELTPEQRRKIATTLWQTYQKNTHRSS